MTEQDCLYTEEPCFTQLEPYKDPPNVVGVILLAFCVLALLRNVYRSIMGE